MKTDRFKEHNTRSKRRNSLSSSERLLGINPLVKENSFLSKKSCCSNFISQNSTNAGPAFDKPIKFFNKDEINFEEPPGKLINLLHGQSFSSGSCEYTVKRKRGRPPKKPDGLGLGIIRNSNSTFESKSSVLISNSEGVNEESKQNTLTNRPVDGSPSNLLDNRNAAFQSKSSQLLINSNEDSNKSTQHTSVNKKSVGKPPSNKMQNRNTPFAKQSSHLLTKSDDVNEKTPLNKSVAKKTVGGSPSNIINRNSAFENKSSFLLTNSNELNEDSTQPTFIIKKSVGRPPMNKMQNRNTLLESKSSTQLTNSNSFSEKSPQNKSLAKRTFGGSPSNIINNRNSAFENRSSVLLTDSDDVNEKSTPQTFVNKKSVGRPPMNKMQNRNMPFENKSPALLSCSDSVNVKSSQNKSVTKRPVGGSPSNVMNNRNSTFENKSTLLLTNSDGVNKESTQHKLVTKKPVGRSFQNTMQNCTSAFETKSSVLMTNSDNINKESTQHSKRPVGRPRKPLNDSIGSKHFLKKPRKNKARLYNLSKHLLTKNRSLNKKITRKESSHNGNESAKSIAESRKSNVKTTKKKSQRLCSSVVKRIASTASPKKACFSKFESTVDLSKKTKTENHSVSDKKCSILQKKQNVNVFDKNVYIRNLSIKYKSKRKPFVLKKIAKQKVAKRLNKTQLVKKSSETDSSEFLTRFVKQCHMERQLSKSSFERGLITLQSDIFNSLDIEACDRLQYMTLQKFVKSMFSKKAMKRTLKKSDSAETETSTAFVSQSAVDLYEPRKRGRPPKNWLAPSNRLWPVSVFGNTAVKSQKYDSNTKNMKRIDFSKFKGLSHLSDPEIFSPQVSLDDTSSNECNDSSKKLFELLHGRKNSYNTFNELQKLSTKSRSSYMRKSNVINCNISPSSEEEAGEIENFNEMLTDSSNADVVRLKVKNVGRGRKRRREFSNIDTETDGSCQVTNENISKEKPVARKRGRASKSSTVRNENDSNDITIKHHKSLVDDQPISESIDCVKTENNVDEIQSKPRFKDIFNIRRARRGRPPKGISQMLPKCEFERIPSIVGKPSDSAVQDKQNHASDNQSRRLLEPYVQKRHRPQISSTATVAERKRSRQPKIPFSDSLQSDKIEKSKSMVATNKSPSKCNSRFSKMFSNGIANFLKVYNLMYINVNTRKPVICPLCGVSYLAPGAFLAHGLTKSGCTFPEKPIFGRAEMTICSTCNMEVPLDTIEMHHAMRHLTERLFQKDESERLAYLIAAFKYTPYKLYCEFCNNVFNKKTIYVTCLAFIKHTEFCSKSVSDLAVSDIRQFKCHQCAEMFQLVKWSFHQVESHSSLNIRKKSVEEVRTPAPPSQPPSNEGKRKRTSALTADSKLKFIISMSDSDENKEEVKVEENYQAENEVEDVDDSYPSDSDASGEYTVSSNELTSDFAAKPFSKSAISFKATYKNFIIGQMHKICLNPAAAAVKVSSPIPNFQFLNPNWISSLHFEKIVASYRKSTVDISSAMETYNIDSAAFCVTSGEPLSTCFISSDDSEYLIVSSKPFSQFSPISTTATFKHALEVYRYSNKTLRFAFAAVHNEGACWQIHHVDSVSCNGIGVVFCAFSSGHPALYTLSTVPQKYSKSKTNDDKVLACHLSSFINLSTSLSSQCTTVDSCFKGEVLCLAAGFACGSVTVWFCASLVAGANLSPSLVFSAQNSCVNKIVWDRHTLHDVVYTTSLLLDESLNIWRLNDLQRPQHVLSGPNVVDMIPNLILPGIDLLCSSSSIYARNSVISLLNDDSKDYYYQRGLCSTGGDLSHPITLAFNASAQSHYIGTESGRLIATNRLMQFSSKNTAKYNLNIMNQTVDIVDAKSLHISFKSEKNSSSLNYPEKSLVARRFAGFSILNSTCPSANYNLLVMGGKSGILLVKPVK